jgi:glycosyltransferase involved in cell wall biosynthesis
MTLKRQPELRKQQMNRPTSPLKSPAISVIIPAYNQAQYVSEAIRSVLGQTYPDFELIVIDDGSTDETPKILAKFSDPRIRVIWQPNAGLSAARNTGLRESHAQLVTFLDADDYFLPDKLEVLSRHLERYPEVGMVVGNERLIDPYGKVISAPAKEHSSLSLPGLLIDNPICVSAVLLRRRWLERIGNFDESLRACEDWDLWIRLLDGGCKMAWVDNFVVAYRIHPGQMTRQADRMRIAIFSTLDKFFGKPDLPRDLYNYKDVAYSRGWISAAAFAYLSNECDKGAQHLTEAICLDPTLKEKRFKQLVEILVGWSSDPRASEPVDFLRRIVENPPKGHIELVRQFRRAQADVILGSLYKGTGSEKSWRTRRRDLIKVIRYQPKRILNRGVLRMMVDAWFHL